MSAPDPILAAKGRLARDGIDVTVRVEDGCVYVHVVQTTRSGPATWFAVLGAFQPICPLVQINGL